MYNIPPFTTTNQFLIEIARIRGRMKKGGIPDLENAARSILQDWNAGRIPYYTLPPKNKTTDISSTIVVGGLSDEFEMGEVVGVEGKMIEEAVKSREQMNKKMYEFSCGEVLDVEMGSDMPREYQRFEEMMDEDSDSHDDLEDITEEDLIQDTTMDVEMEMDEDDVSPLSHIIINTKTKKIAKKEVEEPIMDDALRALNPQHNQTLKKNRKMKKKLEKRLNKNDDAYDFGDYFGDAVDEDDEMEN